MNNSSSTGLLQKLNDEKAIVLIPAIVFVGVLMLTGLIGNIVVCYFYGCKTKTTPTSCFILGLSIFDLLSCTISVPMEIVDMRFFYMFPDVTVCKVLTATNFVFTISSGIILIAIATERYRRICLPFRKQITVSQARLICFISVLIACFFSWPSLVFYTIVTVNVPVPGSESIQGYDCTTVKDDSLKVYLNAFNVIQILLFIFAVVALIVLYALVYRQLIRMKTFRRSASGEDKVSSRTSEFLNNSAEKSNKCKDTLKRRGNSTELIESNEDTLKRRGNSTELIESNEDTLKRRGNSTELIEYNEDTLKRRGNSTELIEYNEDTLKRRGNSTDLIESNEDTLKRRGNSTELIEYNESKNPTNDSKMRNDFLRDVTSVTSDNKSMTQETSFVREQNTKLSESNSVKKDESGRPVVLEQINILAQHEKERDSLDLSENDETESPNRTSGKFNSDSVSRESDINRLRSVYSLNKTGSKDKNTVRYTTVMFVITITFIMSFLPYLCLVVWRSLSADYDLSKMTDVQLIFFSIGIRSYFLNGALNPMIYGFFNSQFREFVISVFTVCCGAKPNCERVSDTTDTLKTNT